MGMKEEVNEMKKQVYEAQNEEHSLAMCLLQDMKKANKRLFVMWVMTFVGLLVSVGYTLYLLNDIEYIESEEIIDIEDVENIDGSNIQIGDN